MSRRLTARQVRAAGALFLAGALASGGLALASADGQARTPAASRPRPAARAAAPPRVIEGRIPRELLAGLDPLRHRAAADDAEGAGRVAELPDGRRAVLTLEPGLQSFMERTLEQYAVPYAALVAMEPATGRVLAYVSHSSANPNAGDLVLDPTPPAASVFKVITGAALVDAGKPASTRICYGGGASRLHVSDLEDTPGRDNQCATLGEAMGGSINAVFAKLADRTLEPPTLERYASAFGFGHALPFDVPTQPSPAEVPTERLEFARTAAGFWHMHMSPFHGALIAATVANGGEMPRPFLVERVVDARGVLLARARPEAFRRVISAETARAVNGMMRNTVSQGTARRTFHDPAGVPFLPGMEIAGKTGTLSGENPYRGYTWWVGFAPANRPTIAVAALVVNTPMWRIKASFVAREALRYHLVQAPHERAEAERRAARQRAADEASAASTHASR
jgi:cell division protein FtsI/penicillin-binding protein 2